MEPNNHTEINTPVAKFLKKISIYFYNCGFEPLPDSPAGKEIKSFSRKESIQTAFSIASQSLIAANDYLKALDTLVDLKNFSVAPWSCARGMLEAAAICKWLIDTNIDSRERVSRSLSLRYAALEEQSKLARYDRNKELEKIIKRKIVSIEKTAIDLGYKPVRNKKNKRTSIGQNKPSITSLVEQQFGHEKLYRLLSGMAHSRYTSLMKFSLAKEDIKRNSGAVFREAVPIEFQLSLVSGVAAIYVKCLWHKIIQYGFDAAKAAVLFEEVYDELKLPDQNSTRFWRTVINTDR